jgi:hypothetical protein
MPAASPERRIIAAYTDTRRDLKAGGQGDQQVTA